MLNDQSDGFSEEESVDHSIASAGRFGLSSFFKLWDSLFTRHPFPRAWVTAIVRDICLSTHTYKR